MKKLVGMQIVVEGLALYSFREMRNLTEEPLLKDLLTYVARDESRHHAYGVQYVERCVPVPQRRASAPSSRTSRSRRPARLIDNAISRASSRRCSDLGRRSASTRPRCSRASHASATRSRATCRKGRRLGPVQGFVIPTLRRCGLLCERVATHFHDFLRENFGARVAGEDVQEFLAPPRPAGGHRAGSWASSSSVELRRRSLAEEDRDVGLRAMAAGDAEHEVDELVVAGADTNAVQPKEGEAACQPDALVAVDERVVLDEMEQIRSGLLRKGRVQELAFERHLRHRERRLEEATVADAQRPSVATHLVSVDGEYLIEREEEDGHAWSRWRLLGQTAKGASVLSVEVAEEPLQPRGAFARTDR